MKRILLSILATMTASLLSADLPKHPPEEEIEKQKKSILEQKTDQLDPRSRSVRNDLNDQEYFNGSHWYLMAGNDGAWGHNYEIGAPGGRWPRGSSRNTVFSAGLWIGSNYDGEPRVSKVRFDSDFSPGVLDGDPYSDEARVLKVNQISIQAWFLMDLHGFGMSFGEFGVAALFLVSFPFAEEL